MSYPFPPPKLISQHEFDTYAAAWQHAVEGEALPHVFQRDKKLAYVSFPLQSIVWLLSTVGAQRIKARFIVKPDETDEGGKSKPHFSVVLYATDALDGRISAYYLADNTAMPASVKKPAEVEMESEQSAADTPGGQVPHGLAGVWLTNWADSDVAEPAMFTSNYGPLQGYTFDMDDFRESLFYAKDFFTHPESSANYEMHVAFGLHEYYSAFHKKENRKHTFGLVLRVYEAAQASYRFNTTANATDEPEELYFYDLSTPNPPGG